MRRMFTKDVPIEILIDGAGVEVVATVRFSTTPYDPGISSGPAEICYPPEGGEIEDVEVLTLVSTAMPSSASPSGRLVQGTPDLYLECPQWLKEKIVENISEETLNEAVDWDED